MRWGSEAKNDDRRYIIKYAWYPIRIENRRFDPKIEWRWLETVKIRQNYNTNSDNDNMIKELLNWIKVGLFGGFWENECFIEFDKDELRDQKLKKLGI